MRILIIVISLLAPHFGMSQVDKLLKEYMDSPVFVKHKLEAYQVHKELIEGKVGSTLKLFLVDTLIADTINLQNINEALASEQFKQHSTRIDTQVTVGVFPVKFTTMVAFRDIHYLGNNIFRRYRVNISIQWNEKFQIVRRQVTFGHREIKSRQHWTRGAWWDISKLFEEK